MQVATDKKSDMERKTYFLGAEMICNTMPKPANARCVDSDRNDYQPTMYVDRC